MSRVNEKGRWSLALTRYVQHVINPAGDPVIAILVPPAAWEEKIKAFSLLIVTNYIIFL